MLRRLGDRSRLSSALRVVATIEGRISGHAAARRGLEEAVALARETGQQVALSYALLELSNVEAAEGHLERSIHLLEESFPISEALGDEVQLIMSRHNVACALREMGRSQAAHREMTQLIGPTLRQRSPIFSIIFAEDYAAVLAELSEAATAARLFGSAEAERIRIGVPRTASQEAELDGPLAKARDALGETQWDTEHRLGRDTPLEQMLRSVDIPAENRVPHLPQVRLLPSQAVPGWPGHRPRSGSSLLNSVERATKEQAMSEIPGDLPHANEADAWEQVQDADVGLDDSTEELEVVETGGPQAARWDADEADVLEQAHTVKPGTEEDYPVSDDE